jgi:hypothetical protein
LKISSGIAEREPYIECYHFQPLNPPFFSLVNTFEGLSAKMNWFGSSSLFRT